MTWLQLITGIIPLLITVIGIYYFNKEFPIFSNPFEPNDARDLVFGFVEGIFAMFFGCILGMFIFASWYLWAISTGITS